MEQADRSQLKTEIIDMFLRADKAEPRAEIVVLSATNANDHKATSRPSRRRQMVAWAFWLVLAGVVAIPPGYWDPVAIFVKFSVVALAYVWALFPETIFGGVTDGGPTWLRKMVPAVRSMLVIVGAVGLVVLALIAPVLFNFDMVSVLTSHKF